VKKILVVYGTKEGQSAKIANAISDELSLEGFVVDTYNAEEIPSDIRVNDYSGVVAGGSVHVSKYPAPLKKWIKANSAELSIKPSAFFSVCLGVLEKENAQTQKAEKKIVEDFFAWSGWRPKTWTIFAGAVKYSKYGWFTKQIMKMIVKKAGGNTDTSRDYEYTNWNEVKTFAQ
jgi:menaquinone-dependent protoporphyrinogen oxidase